jgi:hypothetical protein
VQFPNEEVNRRKDYYNMSEEREKRYFAHKKALWDELEASMTQEEFIEFVAGMVDVMEGDRLKLC